MDRTGCLAGVGLTLWLSGCSFLPLPGEHWSFNPQSYQGCAVAKYSDETRDLAVYDCKDRENVDLTIDLNSDGITDLHYVAFNVDGSTAAAIRSNLGEALSEAGVELAPAVIDRIIKSAVPGP